MSSKTNQPVANTPAPAESEASGATVPMWLIVLLALFLYWGALYFDQNGGWFSAQVYAPYHSIAEVQGFQIVEAGPGAAGKAVFGKTCIACHQANGQGTPGQFPPLVGSEWVNEAEPGRVIRIVLKGLQGPITVKGQAFNNVMVPWDAPPPVGLTDEEIAAVLTYVRQNKDWGNNAPPVTPERVKAVRDKLKAQGHTASFTPEELLKIAPAD